MLLQFVFAILFFVNNCYCFKLDTDLYKLFDELENERNQEYSNEAVIDFIKYTKTLSVADFGAIGGLATEHNGNLVVFHRASRKWTFDSFDANDRFNVNKYKVIPENTVVHIAKDTKVVNEWGANTFYMPHGLTIDHEGNYWLTDVALHQVFKYENGKFDKPSLTLGVAFENGDDNTHLCKPADVGVSSMTGDVFVADGYCNSRIAQFDKNGRFLKEFRMPNDDALVVPHSIAVIDDSNLVCVADREKGRIVCFNIETGKVDTIIEHHKMKRVFAIEYNKETELLHAVSGPAGNQRPLGFTFNADKGAVFGDFLFEWEPSNVKFQDPHDITTTRDGHRIYTGELDGNIEEFKLE